MADVLLCAEEAAQWKVAEEHHRCSLLVRAAALKGSSCQLCSGIHSWGTRTHIMLLKCVWLCG